MRIVEYTISDPALPGYGEVHRLVTTLLNPEAFPALELARAYHERWEIELVIDEVDTHQHYFSVELSWLRSGSVVVWFGVDLKIPGKSVWFRLQRLTPAFRRDLGRANYSQGLRCFGDGRAIA